MVSGERETGSHVQPGVRCNVDAAEPAAVPTAECLAFTYPGEEQMRKNAIVDGHRRLLLRATAAGAMAALPAGLLVSRRVGAAALAPTPAQTTGPFYPLEYPPDHDADLVQVRGQAELARGDVAVIEGNVTDLRGRALDGAMVEIWQCDANGRYHHPGDRRRGEPDPAFQGYGRARTDDAGGYRFRTIRPVAYPGRAPHIHFRVSAEGLAPLTTQMYVLGDPANARDGLLNRLPDEAARRRLQVELVADGGGQALRGRFDIVLAG